MADVKVSENLFQPLDAPAVSENLVSLFEKKCEQCGKVIGPEWLLGPTCLACCRKNHRQAVKYGLGYKRARRPASEKEGGKMGEMELTVRENRLRPRDDTKLLREIYSHLAVWEKNSPKREKVANILRRLYPDAFVYVGGCHVAVHLLDMGTRDILITGTTEDWA